MWRERRTRRRDSFGFWLRWTTKTSMTTFKRPLSACFVTKGIWSYMIQRRPTWSEIRKSCFKPWKFLKEKICSSSTLNLSINTPFGRLSKMKKRKNVRRKKKRQERVKWCLKVARRQKNLAIYRRSKTPKPTHLSLKACDTVSTISTMTTPNLYRAINRISIKTATLMSQSWMCREWTLASWFLISK